MMQDSEVIKLVKPVPSDRLATQVLVMWYNTVRPKWKKPLDLAITAFFVLMTLYSFSLRPLPIFAWLSLAGALMAIILSWFYVPFLAKAALAANKKVPMYHQEKDYVFQDLIREIDAKATPEILADICRDCCWFPISACCKNICEGRYVK